MENHENVKTHVRNARTILVGSPGLIRRSVKDAVYSSDVNILQRGDRLLGNNRETTRKQPLLGSRQCTDRLAE
jgi:hypothetical protein